uniref:C2H2-type domain-containing protein n=1 Tax=Meloidogyne enterolobii TaxID=390850 RepID=A0A6V7W3S4_MELEN|nr:unnamed protein product [Meloidogyne enterolobii]
MPCSSEMRFCLICKRKISTNGLINHIAQHLDYKRHKCTKCSFRSVSVEDMVDHQNQTRHIVEFDSLKNWYLERVCQLIYSDFDYVEKHGVEAIRRMGSAFGDRKRLEDLLKAESNLNMNFKLLKRMMRLNLWKMNLHQISKTTPRPTPPIDPQAGIDLLDHWTRSIEKMAKSPDILKNLSNSNNSIVSTSINSNVNKNNLNKSGRCSFKESTQTIPIVHGAGIPATENLSLEQKTKRCLADLHRQITNGIPKRKCQMCNQNVDNDYRSMKNHVFRVHFRPYNLNKFTQLLERCFKKDGNNCNIFITNDLQCNVCGRELRTKTGRFNHVSVCHSDYIWKCIYTQCDFKVNSFANFLRHLQIQHRKKSFQLEHFEKDAYIRLRADYELKLTPLVRKCFPFDLPAIILGGNINEEEIPVDEIVSNFMPTREIKQPLTPRNALKQQQQNTPTKSVDEEMVDPSSDEEEKKVDKKELNEKIIELNKNLVGKKYGGNNNNRNRISSSSNSGERLTGTTTNKMYGNRNVMTCGQVQRYNQGYFTPKRNYNAGFARIFFKGGHKRRFRYYRKDDDFNFL